MDPHCKQEAFSTERAELPKHFHSCPLVPRKHVSVTVTIDVIEQGDERKQWDTVLVLVGPTCQNLLKFGES